MKLFKCLFLLLLTGFAVQVQLKAVDSVITLFIKEKTIPQEKHFHTNKKSVSESLIQPSFINAIGKDRSWLRQPGVDGLQACYVGYIATSNKNGQITFPRIQQSDTINLLITPEIEPEFMISATLIHEWLPKNNCPAAFYEINRKKHKKLNTYYFDVKKLAIPTKIPRNTITIFAHPDHIEVPVGISLNTYSTNFILPELQAQKINTVKNSLYTLSIKRYFEQINIANKNNSPTIASMVMNL